MSISLYIHIPFCVSKCSYCDFFSKTNLSFIDDYVDSLLNEIKFRLDHSDKKIKSIYIGGGTPSLLKIDHLLKIQNKIENFCELTSDYEFTIEVNPDDLTESYIEQLKNTKINRISCGIQSMSDSVLEFANRRSRYKENVNALYLLSNVWENNFSIDLICGLPKETENSFFEGLDKIISYNPNHISMYSLTVEDETPLGKMINNGNIEYDFDFSDSLWLKAKKLLEEKGYFQYEVSNFSKEGFESKHNLAYWNHQAYIGVGSGATGTLYFSNGEGYRYTNTNDILKYINFWKSENTLLENSIFRFGNKVSFNNEYLTNVQEEEFIDLETSKIEYFMMGLRKLSGINSTHYYSVFGSQIETKIVELFIKWQQKGLCKITKTQNNINYTLGKEGILFLNTFLSELLN